MKQMGQSSESRVPAGVAPSHHGTHSGAVRHTSAFCRPLASSQPQGTATGASATSGAGPESNSSAAPQSSGGAGYGPSVETPCAEPAWEWGPVTRPPVCNPNARLTAGLGLFHALWHTHARRRAECADGADCRDAHPDLQTACADDNSLLAGRYRVLGEIGRGTFSRTFRAVDLYYRCCAPWGHVRPDDPSITSGSAHSPDCVAGYDARCNVAIKVMLDEYALIGLHEISRLRTINMFDPARAFSVIGLRDAVSFGASVCLIFDLMSPQALHRYFGHGPTGAPSLTCASPEVVARRFDALRGIASQLLASLSFFESIGVLHADLKPENILVELSHPQALAYAAGAATPAVPLATCPSPFPRVKVIDFGNAMRATLADTEAYLADFEVQSLVYRAPEVLWGLPFTPRIDVWSVGCILAELATGRVLFHATDRRGVAARIGALLGPLPASPLSRGLFAGELADLVAPAASSALTMDQHAARIGRLSAALEVRDFVFLSFMDSLLQPDPALRTSAGRALAHPFLAPLFPFRSVLPATAVGDASGRRYPTVGLEWHLAECALPVTRHAAPTSVLPVSTPAPPRPHQPHSHPMNLPAVTAPTREVTGHLRGISARSRRSLLDFERRQCSNDPTPNTNPNTNPSAAAPSAIAFMSLATQHANTPCPPASVVVGTHPGGDASGGGIISTCDREAGLKRSAECDGVEEWTRRDGEAAVAGGPTKRRRLEGPSLPVQITYGASEEHNGPRVTAETVTTQGAIHDVTAVRDSVIGVDEEVCLVSPRVLSAGSSVGPLCPKLPPDHADSVSMRQSRETSSGEAAPGDGDSVEASVDILIVDDGDDDQDTSIPGGGGGSIGIGVHGIHYPVFSTFAKTPRKSSVVVEEADDVVLL